MIYDAKKARSYYFYRFRPTKLALFFLFSGFIVALFFKTIVMWRFMYH